MIVLLLALGCGSAPEPAWEPLPEVPSDSIYQLDPPLVDQSGHDVPFALYRGHPTVVSMFYASCPMACPMLIEDVKGLEAALEPSSRQDLRVLLVSLDPARDTPELMAEVVQRHAVDVERWTLARTDPVHVREVAAVLGIRYRAGQDGEMNHSSILTLVDREGRPVLQREGLDRDDGPLIHAIGEM